MKFSNTQASHVRVNGGYCDENADEASSLALSGMDARSCAAVDKVCSLSGLSTPSTCPTLLDRNLNSPTIRRTPSFFSKQRTNNLLERENLIMK